VPDLRRDRGIVEVVEEQRTRPARPGAFSGLAEAAPLPEGERVGDWVVERRVGGGGFGEVYEARHHATGQPGALKVLHAQLVSSPEMIARFGREIAVLRRLDHPNVVRILDAGVDAAGRSFLCMELLVGKDLSRVIRERKRLAPRGAIEVLAPVCDAVARAHDLGIVHRDLKASNVFVCDHDRIVLLDFGIAKISDTIAPELTASHQTLGTPGCMAPEQIHGGTVDVRTDVYALGGMLFHMLTGRLAFEDPSPTMTQYLHLHAQRPRPSLLAPLPPRLDDVILRAMAIEPADRFRDARTFLAAARAALRESAHDTGTKSAEHAAIFATVTDGSGGAELDEALISDLEAVLPMLERFLGERGFSLALDLGSSALFVARLEDPREPVAAVLAAWDQLERRSGRDPRVRVGVALHRGPATLVGARLEPGPLLRPETWGLPEPLDGVWLTHAIEQGGRRAR
jgi:serine/threonine protein kinase